MSAPIQYIISSYGPNNRKNINFVSVQQKDFDTTINYCAFKIWLYLCFLPHDVTINSHFDYTSFTTLYPMSRRQYNRSFQELIDHHYLIPTGDNHYDFYPLPHIKEDTTHALS